MQMIKLSNQNIGQTKDCKNCEISTGGRLSKDSNFGKKEYNLRCPI